VTTRFDIAIGGALRLARQLPALGRPEHISEDGAATEKPISSKQQSTLKSHELFLPVSVPTQIVVL
jgi:hypothetical protein